MLTIQQAMDKAALGHRLDPVKGLVIYKLRNTNQNIGVSPELCLIVTMLEIHVDEFFKAQKAGVFPPIDLMKKDT